MSRMKKNIFRNVLPLVALFTALILVGCSGGEEKAAEAAPAAASTSASAAVQAEVAPFEVPELDNDGVAAILADSKGKAVFLCFWSVTCPACDREIPELEKLAQTYGPDELRLLLVNVDPTADNVAAYFGGKRPVSEVYHGTNGLAQAYGIYTIPHLVLYDAEGIKFMDQSGFFPAKMLEALVEHALGRGEMGAS